MARRRTQRRPQQRHQQDDTIVDIVEVKEQAESFIEQNQMTIIGVTAALLLIVGGYFAYKHLYLLPRQEAAVAEMSQAQLMFERDSFAAALENPGAGKPGFIAIAEQYGGVPAGNAAKYYAGTCYLNLGRFQDAIDYLSDYSAGDPMTSITKLGMIGDAHAELGDMDAAIKHYEKAATASKNDFLTPYYLKKAAMLALKQGDRAKAKTHYSRIKDEFPTSTEGLEADKYLAYIGQ